MKLIRAEAGARYATLDIGTAQAKILRHLQDGISQAELARITDTAPALLGRTIEPLIERAWIRRTRSEEDRRQYVLALTAAGKRARDRIEGLRGELIDELATALDERDRADFARIAAKLLAHFRRDAAT
jgi:DNA-binding MarR family transcriptional regulator